MACPLFCKIIPNTEEIVSNYDHRIVKLFTHGDLDGFGCDYVARAAFREYGVEYSSLVCSYVNIDDRINKFLDKEQERVRDTEEYHPPIILISDIIPTRQETLERLEEWSTMNSTSRDYQGQWRDHVDIYKKLGNFAGPILEGGVLVMDHHEAAVNAAVRYPWVYANSNQCGTTAVFHALKGLDTVRLEGQNVLQFCQLVEIYDLWKLEDPMRSSAEKLNSLFNFWGYQDFMKHMLAYHIMFTVAEPGHWSIDCNGPLANKLREKDKMQVKYTVEKANLKETTPFLDHFSNKFYIVFEDLKVGEVGDAVLTAFPNVDYVVIASLKNNQISFRSRGKVNVTALAQLFGGGGHPSGKASGAMIKNLGGATSAEVASKLRELQSATATIPGNASCK